MNKLPPWVQQEIEASIDLLNDESDDYEMICNMIRNVARNCYSYGLENRSAAKT